MADPEWMSDSWTPSYSNLAQPSGLAAHVGPLIGLPAWNVEVLSGSNLNFSFGQPYVEITEVVERPTRGRHSGHGKLMRTTSVMGDWNLWINMCHWRASTREVYVSESERMPEHRRDSTRLFNCEVIMSTQGTLRWRASDRELLVAHSESPDEHIASAARMFDGQILESLMLVPDTAITVFRFDLGGTLWTIPYGQSADDDDTWILFCPGGWILSMNGDATFNWEHDGAAMEKQRLWYADAGGEREHG